MAAVAPLIPARQKNVNRAVVCDENFVEFVRGWNGQAHARPAPDEEILPGSRCSARDFAELFESQLISRHLDLMARVLRVQQKVFYTIADIALYAYTHVAHEGGFDLAPYPAVNAWLARVAGQPRHIPITQG